MQYDDDIKEMVWTTIQYNRNCSFDNLMKRTNLNFMDLSAIIGELLQEKRISLRINHIPASSTPVYISRQEYLFSQFMKLLSEHATSERSVSYYASKLCINPKYLHKVVKQMSGKTPLDWIKEKVINEMKDKICHTQYTIKEISFQLNFPNTSFFGKYFKAETGVSPAHYRKMHSKQK